MRVNIEEDNASRLLTARSVRVDLGRNTAKRVKKLNENYISSGPPMLQENPTIQRFYKWQNSLMLFVRKLPGYVDGMLVPRPDYDSLGRGVQKRLKDVYDNIHGWLKKAGIRRLPTKLRP